jgi:hypothetical protein
MCGQRVMTSWTSWCIIQCHQVVLVVELVEAGTLSTCLGLACVANASSGAGGTGKDKVAEAVKKLV